VAIPQRVPDSLGRGPDNLWEEVSPSQSDLEEKSELSTLHRTLAVQLRKCLHPHCPDRKKQHPHPRGIGTV